METQSNTRKGSAKAKTSSRANIGSHVSKPAEPAIVQIAQRTDGDHASVKPGKDLVGKARELLHGFRPESDKLKSLKEQAEKQRGGLSDIVFEIVKLGWTNAPKQTEAFLFCRDLLNSAEMLERSGYQRANRLAELPTAKDALGASWQTYKSQLLKCVQLGYDPTQFSNGTVYRTKTSPKRTRKPKQTTGESAAAETAAATLDKEGSTLRTELQAAITEFVLACKGATETDQLKHASQLHKLTVKVVELNRKNAPADTETEETAETATGTM